MSNIDSFRFVPNSINCGEEVNLRVEGIAEPGLYVDKLCKIEVFEVDSPLASSDVIAVFEGQIGEDKSTDPPKYFFKNLARTDSFSKSLPGPETQSISDRNGNNWTCSYKPSWSVPHFKVSFATSPGPSLAHSILFREAHFDREHYIMEIGFKLYIDGDLKYTYMSKRSYCTMAFGESLADNCRVATELLMENHSDMIAQRGIGTHYGSQYTPATPVLQAAFTRDKREYNLNVGSCIDYVLSACALGHEKTISSKDWDFIKGHMVRGMGMSLGEGLEKAGWMGIYFNPDVKHPRDKNTNNHNYTYSIAKTKRRYQAIDTTDNNRMYKFSVKQLVVNYSPTTIYDDGTTETDVTPSTSDQLNKLKQVPFGVVNVRGGTHTALFSKGYIFEVHWDKSYTSSQLFEKTLLENWWWLSGAIQIPEGTWPT